MTEIKFKGRPPLVLEELTKECNPLTMCGFEWSCEQIGFGQIYIYFDEKSGKTKIDSETMGKEFVKAMLCQMVDDAELND